MLLILASAYVVAAVASKWQQSMANRVEAEECEKSAWKSLIFVWICVVIYAVMQLLSA